MTLEHYWTILVKRWWLILLSFFAVGVGTFYVSSKLITPLYQSTTVIQVTAGSSSNPTDYGNLLASAQLVQTEGQLTTSDPVLREVVSHYPGLTVEQLAKEVTAKVKPGTSLLEIDVLDPSPTRAAGLANDIATTLIKQQTQSAQQSNGPALQKIQQDIQHTQQQITSTMDKITALQAIKRGNQQAQIDTLNKQLAALQEHLSQDQSMLAQLQSTQTQNANLFVIEQHAQLPLKPDRPNVPLNTAAGFMAGLLQGLLLVVLLELLDTRVRTEETLTQLLNWPILATIWRVDTAKEAVVNPPGRSANSEAYRMLRTNIGFSVFDKPVQLIMLTSAVPRDGKSTVAANLAIFMAKSGKNTLLIDADLRRPTLHEKFHLPASIKGLTNAVVACSQLQAVASPPSVVQQSTNISVPPSFSLDPYTYTVGIPNLLVMLSGPLPPNPSELLDSKAMDRFIVALASSGAEVVIFDTPPLLGLSDSSILAAKVDAAIVVTDITRADKRNLKRVKDLLNKAGTSVLGCVVNKQSPSRKDMSYYYSYTYSYHTDEEKHNKENEKVPTVAPAMRAQSLQPSQQSMASNGSVFGNGAAMRAQSLQPSQQPIASNESVFGNGAAIPAMRAQPLQLSQQPIASNESVFGNGTAIPAMRVQPLAPSQQPIASNGSAFGKVLGISAMRAQPLAPSQQSMASNGSVFGNGTAIPAMRAQSLQLSQQPIASNESVLEEVPDQQLMDSDMSFFEYGPGQQSMTSRMNVSGNGAAIPAPRVQPRPPSQQSMTLRMNASGNGAAIPAPRVQPRPPSQQSMTSHMKSSNGEKQGGERQRVRLRGKKTQSSKQVLKKPYVPLWILLCIFVGGSLLSLLAYPRLVDTYHRDVALAQTGADHLRKAATLLASLAANPLDSQTVDQAQQEFAAALPAFVQVDADLKPVPRVSRFIPGIGGRLNAAFHLVPAAVGVSQAGIAGCDLLKVLITKLHNPFDKQGQGLTMADVTIIQQDFNRIKMGLDLAINEANQVHLADVQFDPRISTMFATLQKEIPTLQVALDSLDKLLPMLPTLLGIGTSTYYLIEVLDSTELRPGGGFIGNYGILTLSGGRVTSNRVIDTYLLDHTYLNAGHVIPWPAAYHWYPFRNHGWGLRDSDFDGDFPTSARNGETLYKREGGTLPLVGVIAITPAFMSAVLTLTGPIAVPEYNEMVTAQNLTDRIHYHQLIEEGASPDTASADGYSSQRKHFTSLLGKYVLERVHTVASSLFPKLFHLLTTSLHTKDIQVYFDADPAQKLLQVSHIDASIQSPAGDSVFLVDANTAQNKANQYIVTTINDQVTVDMAGNATHQAVIKFTWTDSHLKGNPFFGPLRYRDYLRVYAPPNSTLQKFTGWTTLEDTGTLFGRQYWGGKIEVPYPVVGTITLTWSVPGAATQDAQGWHYQFLMQRQAGAQETVDLGVTFPSCATIVGKSTGVVSDGNQKVHMAQLLSQDTNVSVDYRC